MLPLAAMPTITTKDVEEKARNFMLCELTL